MDSCINMNTAEFQTLVKLSGLPDFYISAICRLYMNDYGRFPHLDEIPGADSTEYLNKLLDIKLNGTKIEKILNITGKNSIEDSVIYINNKFRDLEVEITPLLEEAVVYITKRPQNIKKSNNFIEHLEDINSPLLFENIINKLRKLYGIQLILITTEELQNSELANIPGVTNSKAFVYNNQIYINTDSADIDAPIHEMMHILMGSLRFSNPEIYFLITEEISKLPFFNSYINKYPNRSLSDIAEEVFVEEFSKLAVGIDSELSNFPNNIKYELFYNAKRVLDTILMGETSVQKINNEILFKSSLSDLCKVVNSKIDSSNFKGTISLHNGEVHRLLANKKQELFENNKLEEYCNG